MERKIFGFTHSKHKHLTLDFIGKVNEKFCELLPHEFLMRQSEENDKYFSEFDLVSIFNSWVVLAGKNYHSITAMGNNTPVNLLGKFFTVDCEELSLGMAISSLLIDNKYTLVLHVRTDESDETESWCCNYPEPQPTLKELITEVNFQILTNTQP